MFAQRLLRESISFTKRCIGCIRLMINNYNDNMFKNREINIIVRGKKLFPR